tara:strand:+ start:302 stop:466 length:165 start_codon:yes stop_codon:yes gene_type:complete
VFGVTSPSSLGLLIIKQFTIGLGTQNSFGIKELSTHTTVFARPVSSGVIKLQQD